MKNWEGVQADRLQGLVYAGWEWALLPTSSWKHVPLSFAQASRKPEGSTDRQHCAEVETEAEEVESSHLAVW